MRLACAFSVLPRRGSNTHPLSLAPDITNHLPSYFQGCPLLPCPQICSLSKHQPAWPRPLGIPSPPTFSDLHSCLQPKTQGNTRVMEMVAVASSSIPQRLPGLGYLEPSWFPIPASSVALVGCLLHASHYPMNSISAKPGTVIHILQIRR